jgi:molybdate transport system substrate-binding protein
MRRIGSLIFAVLLAACAQSVNAAEIAVAVAANFTGTLKTIQPQFENASGHKLKLISGSTGKIYAQITEGAPFDVFLSADDIATGKLAESGAGVPETEFTYALGTLALFSADPEFLKGDGVKALKEGSFRKLAIANPKLAPYGQAAEATLQALGLFEALKDKLVTAENVAQTFALVDTQNAELGFVALSQVLSPEVAGRGSCWVVPDRLHEPIRQNAILLARAKDPDAAREFLDFLRSAPAREAMAVAGYAIGIGEWASSDMRICATVGMR